MEVFFKINAYGVCILKLFSFVFSPIVSFFKKIQCQYAKNIKDESLFLRISFDEILVRWGITSEEARLQALFQKKCECILGLLLFVLGLLCIFLDMPAHTVLFFVTRLAVFSLAAFGCSLFLTALWRLQCLQKRTFIPFLRWIRSFFYG